MDTQRRKVRDSGATVLLAGLGVTLLLGVVAAVAGGVLTGPTAAWGALVGAALIAVVCAGGSLVVNLVAGVVPWASLMFALLTYTLQVVVLVTAFLALERSGLLGAELDRGWLGGTAVAATVVWLVSQVVLAFRTRVPVYDLPVVDPSAAPAAGNGHPADRDAR